MEARLPKLALVSHVLPPSSSGQAVVLYRLLRALTASSYCLISGKDYRPEVGKHYPDQATYPLPGKYCYLLPERQVRLLSSPLLRRFASGLRMGRAALKCLLRLGRLQPKETQPTGLSPKPPSIAVAARDETSSLWNRFRTMLQSLEDRVNVPSGVQQRARQMTRLIRGERCHAVVACSGDLLDLPAACLAAQAGTAFLSLHVR